MVVARRRFGTLSPLAARPFSLAQNDCVSAAATRFTSPAHKIGQRLRTTGARFDARYAHRLSRREADASDLTDAPRQRHALMQMTLRAKFLGQMSPMAARVAAVLIALYLRRLRARGNFAAGTSPTLMAVCKLKLLIISQAIAKCCPIDICGEPHEQTSITCAKSHVKLRNQKYFFIFFPNISLQTAQLSS